MNSHLSFLCFAFFLWTPLANACLWGSPITNSFLRGYANSCVSFRYYDLEAAQIQCCACDDCKGITLTVPGTYTLRSGTITELSATSEQSWRKDPLETSCDYDPEVVDFYLDGYACSNKYIYTTKSEAEDACCLCPECTGITCDTRDRCTIRSGDRIKWSQAGEVSYRLDRPDLSCSYTEHLSTYLAGYACTATPYYTLDDATRACCACAGCNGVTQNVNSGHFTLRASSVTASSGHETSWTKDAGVTYLYQSDFDSGTYRITNSGVYILAEDINFNPNPSNDYMPIFPDQEAEYPRKPNGPYHLGFFAALTVETCNVVLDLGGRELRSSDAFAFQQRYYAHIELANQPFLPGQGPSDFGPSIVSACDTVVRNGKMGLSSHHAIHANGASNIILEHLECYDFEVGGIHLNGPNNVTMDHIDIGPSRRDLKQKYFYSHGRFVVPFLEAIEAADPTAQITFSGRASPSTIVDIRTALQHQMDLMFRYFVNDDMTATQDPDWNEALTLFNFNDGNSILPDGAALYGIVLNKNGIAVNGFGDGDTTDVFSNVQITNSHIHDLDLEVLEVIVPAYDDKVMKGPVGDAISYPFMSTDYTNMTNNYYRGNVVADAQMAVAILGGPLGLDIGSSFVSDEVKTWVTNPTDFASAIAPATGNHHLVCNGDDMHHGIKGIIGLRMEFTDDIVISDVDITDLHNFGALGSTICGEYDSPDHPGANVDGTENEGYMGADVRAISTQEVQTIAMSEVNIKNIFTESGHAIGVDVREQSIDVDMFDVDICEVISYLDVPDGTDLALPNSDPSSCGVTVDVTSTVSIDPTVTAGHLASEDVCPSEAANIIQDC